MRKDLNSNEEETRKNQRKYARCRPDETRPVETCQEEERQKMKIIMSIIPQNQQRYDTVGDYWEDENGDLHIVASDLGDVRYSYGVLLHEFVEFILCKHRGISEPSIMAFDLKHLDDEDPGFLKDAPYHKEHVFADAMERLFGQQLGVSAREVDAAIDELFND
jgi:hypothetical protein